MKRFFFIFAALYIAIFAQAQSVWAQSATQFGAASPVAKTAWSVTLRPNDVRRGEMAEIIVAAKVPRGWHIYSLTQKRGGPLPTTIQMTANVALKIAGVIAQPKPKIVRDEGFGINVELLEGIVKFRVPVRILKTARAQNVVQLQIRSMMCDDKTCLPPTNTQLKLNLKIAAGAARKSRIVALTSAENLSTASAISASAISASATATSSTRSGVAAIDDVASQVRRAQGRGVLPFMALAFGAGLLALLTPCVFPMIPITVGFFTRARDGENMAKPRTQWSGALAYCAGIIGTFTILGLAVSAVFGASGITRLAANPWINVAMALLFILLALNLFGLFELRLPSHLVEKVQPQHHRTSNAQSSTRSRIFAPMLMGLAFTMTSFTCTVPFVATALASSSQGEVWWPLLGMLSFSTAFALPFFALALFPQWLARLPKSGSWLVSTKVVMGFLELAAAVKFLSQADFSLNLQIITRPIFLVLWALFAFGAALYLWKIMRFPHEKTAQNPTSSTRSSLSAPRRTLGTLSALGGVYCVFAIGGASLGELEAYLPPRDYGSKAPTQTAWHHDYKRALEQAKRENKPLLINFTGYACTNCRLMENGVFPQTSVRDALRNVVAVELYTDGTDSASKRNSALQQSRFKTVSLPLYVLVDAQNEREIARLEGLHRDPQIFVDFLRSDTSSTRLAMN